MLIAEVSKEVEIVGGELSKEWIDLRRIKIVEIIAGSGTY